MIKTFDYLKTLSPIEPEIVNAVKRVLESGRLLLGPETEAFEREFAEFVGAKYCIGVSSGTTALHLALMGLGIGAGDEVITVSNTCAPTVAAIELSGATPVLVDVRNDDLMMHAARVGEAITEKTRCILPVHLWGQSVDIENIAKIAKEKNLKILEDCSQAHGTMFENRHVGTFGDAAGFSFYPTKNLGAYGDAGAVVTNDARLAERLRRKRMYGYDENSCSLEGGMNARISEMQAAILRVKLPLLPRWLNRRKEIADYYDRNIVHAGIELPYRHAGRNHSFHQYVIRLRERETLIKTFKNNDIGFGIHYPVPIHHMPAYLRLAEPSRPLPVTEKACEEILSLPIHEALSDEEAATVVLAINNM